MITITRTYRDKSTSESFLRSYCKFSIKATTLLVLIDLTLR